MKILTFEGCTLSALACLIVNGENGLFINWKNKANVLFTNFTCIAVFPLGYIYNNNNNKYNI